MYKKLAIFVINFLIIFHSIFFSCTNSCNKQQHIDYKRLLFLWKNFNANPTDEKLLEIYKILPEKYIGTIKPNSDHDKTADYIYNNMTILKKQILLNNRYAIMVGYKLLLISDGDFSSFILECLSQVLINNPNLFLHELKAHFKIITELDALESLLTSYERGLNGDIDALQQTEKIIKALESIVDKKLNDVKKECLIVLYKYRTQLKSEGNKM